MQLLIPYSCTDITSEWILSRFMALYIYIYMYVFYSKSRSDLKPYCDSEYTLSVTQIDREEQMLISKHELA